MKLDRIKFATLIGYCANRGMTVDKTDVEVLNALTEINVEPVPYADDALVNDLLKAMKNGNKIDAIEAYRSLTGLGLKDSKDAVEAQWNQTDKINGQTLKQQMIESLRSSYGSNKNVGKTSARMKAKRKIKKELGYNKLVERPPVNFDKFEG